MNWKHLTWNFLLWLSPNITYPLKLMNWLTVVLSKSRGLWVELFLCWCRCYMGARRSQDRLQGPSFCRGQYCGPKPSQEPPVIPNLFSPNTPQLGIIHSVLKTTGSPLQGRTVRETVAVTFGPQLRLRALTSGFKSCTSSLSRPLSSLLSLYLTKSEKYNVLLTG